MQWLQAIFQSRPQHRYAINSKMLGDDDLIAWSNLGFWDTARVSYPQACSQLAQRLADAIYLNSNDTLLDLGCGQGASLVLWKTHYQVQHIEAVELQASCTALIQKNLNFVHRVHQQSFLNLNEKSFEFKFDAVLCIDAAYHSDLNSFLSSVDSVLNSKARIGFHYLALTDRWQILSRIQQQKYAYLLKCADIQIQHLKTNNQIENTLQEFEFKNIQIKDISHAVLNGFAGFAQQRKAQCRGLAGFKIQMTAKLCEKLYRDGLLAYIQVSAEKVN